MKNKILLLFVFISFNLMAQTNKNFWNRFEIQELEIELELEKLAEEITQDALNYSGDYHEVFLLDSQASKEFSQIEYNELLAKYTRIAPEFFAELSKDLKQNKRERYISYASYLSMKMNGGLPIKYAFEYMKKLEQSSENIELAFFFKVLASFTYYKYSSPYRAITERSVQAYKNLPSIAFEASTILRFDHKEKRRDAAANLLTERIHAFINSTDYIRGNELNFYQVFPIIYDLRFIIKGSNGLSRWWTFKLLESYFKGVMEMKIYDGEYGKTTDVIDLSLSKNQRESLLKTLRSDKFNEVMKEMWQVFKYKNQKKFLKDLNLEKSIDELANTIGCGYAECDVKPHL